MKYIIFILIFVIATKLVINLYYFIICKRTYDTYKEWCTYANNNCPQTKSLAIKIFKKAHIKSSSVVITEPSGYGHLSTYKSDIFDNYPCLDERCIEFTIRAFEEAIGYFKGEMLNAINPIYWIETIIFLPKNILDYIGADTDKVSSKILNVVLTFVWWVLATLAVMYKSNIISFINNFINSI